MDQGELKKALIKQGVRCQDPIVLSQLSTAAEAQGLAVKDMASKLSAFIINQGAAAGALSSALVARFVSTLQRQGDKENQTTRAAATPAGKKGLGQAGFIGTPGIPLAATPQGKAAAGPGAGSPVTPQSAPRSAFSARTNRGQAVTTLNPSVSVAQEHQVRAVHAVPQGVQLAPRHLYLMETLEDKVASTNARITNWQQCLIAALAADGSGAPAEGAAAGSVDWSPVAAPTQEESYFAGRVVCETEGGQLNDTAVMLEGNTNLSGGARVHLNLSLLSAYRLFPGQVVAVKGTNPTGSCIMAKQLWSHLPPPPAGQQHQPAAATAGAGAMDTDSVRDVAGEGMGRSSGLCAVVAAGPFCLADDLSFDPLQELLQQLQPNPPNMMVLLGPFVDVDQPLIAGGMIDTTFQQLFQSQVLERVHSWQESLPVPCQVVFMPAVRDAFHHPTFPQPPINLMAHDQQLVSLQNPCSFTAGPVLMAAQTTDVLRHMASVELAKNAANIQTDRLAALASHVLGQRRFYPLYPPPLGTCLDLTSDSALQLQQLPDLLLLPSDLTPFAKHVCAAKATDSGGSFQPVGPAGNGSTPAEPVVVVVNPGRLAKGSSGGTYARVTVAEGSDSIASRCRVDIIRV